MDKQDFNWDSPLSAAAWQQVLVDPQQLIQLLPESAIQEFKGYIFEQLTDKDGSPQAADLRISQFTFDPQTETGKFRLHFQIDRHFCCSDSSSCANDYIDLRFSYSQNRFLAHGSYFNWTVN